MNFLQSLLEFSVNSVYTLKTDLHIHLNSFLNHFKLFSNSFRIFFELFFIIFELFSNFFQIF